MSAPLTISKNGFIMVYWFAPQPGKFVWYQGNLLRDFIRQPTFVVSPKEPLKSEFRYDESVIQLSDKIFDTIQLLKSENQHCAAAMLASEFYEAFTDLDEEFRRTGKHALSIPLWISVLKLVDVWESRHNGAKIHIGTPLYFLSVGYFLTHNIDPALIYLVKSIDGDIELSKKCPELNYPGAEPAYRTVCLIDNEGNYMHPFVVVPLREQLQDAIRTYNDQFGDESRLRGIEELDSKFLQKSDTNTLKIELIKQLFVLELIKLLQLRNIELEVDSNFFQMLLLNRLFSLTLVIDKLLYVFYPPDGKGKDIDEEPQMFKCIISYAEKKYELKRTDIESIEFNRSNIEQALEFLLEKRSQKDYDIKWREIFIFLIAHTIRNTSAHKIQAAKALNAKFPDIFQSLLEAVFIITGQIHD